MNLTLIGHPLLRRELATLRDRSTSVPAFREALRRASLILAAESSRDIPVRTTRLQTPLEKTRGHVLTRPVVLVPILRAGLGLTEGFLELFPDASVGHIGIYRHEASLQPVDYYLNLPRAIGRSHVFLLDPMLATGGSASEALRVLKKKGARSLRFVALLAAPEGVARVSKDHPDVPIYAATVDRKLNGRGYILPGLGDAGDRYFGTE
jgi:uracil phosphoribosyltransferase